MELSEAVERTEGIPLFFFYAITCLCSPAISRDKLATHVPTNRLRMTPVFSDGHQSSNAF